MSSGLTLDEFKARLSVVDVVRRVVALKARGRDDWWGCCPFHNEKTPSFHVVEGKGYYHCFGCGAHGGPIDFVMATENVDFAEAVARLGERYGLVLARREGAAPPAAAPGLYEANAAAAAWLERQLAEAPGRAARAYLEQRGVSPDLARRFRLGYHPDHADALRQALLAAGFAEPLLLAAGLLRPGTDGRGPYSPFRDRLMFPIEDARGRIVGFGGRALGPAKAKYLNTAETELFHKGRLLYNLPRAAAAARAAGMVIVVEGYMDVIGLARAGIDHALAPLGTAITTEQLEQLWRLAAEPVLCLDGDAAGLRAAERAAELALPLLGPGRSLRFVLLPEGEDPDSLVQRQGGDALRAALERPLSLVDFLWRQGVLGRALDTPERRAAAERELLARVQTIRNGAVRAHYRQELRERLRALWAPVRRAWAARPAVVAPAGAALARGLAAAADRAEAALLEVFLLTPSLLAELEEELAAIPLLRPEHDRMRAEILAWYAAAPTLDAAALRTHLCAHGLGPLIEHILRLRERARAVSRGDADEDVVGAWRSAAARHSRSVARMSGGSTSDEDRADERQAEVIARIGMLNRWLDRADRARVGPAAGETETVCGALGAPAADDGA